MSQILAYLHLPIAPKSHQARRFVKEHIQILIVEDDLLITEMLKEMLCELGYGVVGIAKDYGAALLLLQKHKEINLCFIDINLEAPQSGFDVVKEINEKYFLPFVFLTSYSDKKTIDEAVAFQPQAYLVKPFSQTDLLTTVEIIRGRMKNTSGESKSILIKDGNLNVKLNTSEIRWLKSDNIYVEVKTTNKTYLVRNSLERFLEELQDERFLRTHRSFAVNINHVKAVTGQYLIVESEKIPLSRKFRDTIHSQFGS